MLTPSVNVVQSSFPEALQGEISGLSRERVQPGLDLRHGDRRDDPGVGRRPGTRSYAVALIALVVFGLIGLVAALRLPAKIERA